MLKNYFKIAFRNLIKNKLFSAINLIGLSVGIAVVILIMLFVNDEWSFDSFHAKADNIYRAWVKEHYQGEVFFNTLTPVRLADELQANFPEIEHIARYTNIGELVKQGNFSDQEVIFLADADFLNIFDFPLIEGNKEEVLNALNQIVITPEMAKKYFGESRAVGKTLAVMVSGEWQNFEVTGIISSPPSNSSLQFNMLIPFENAKRFIRERSRQSWTSVNVETYLSLRAGATPESIQPKLQAFMDEQVANIYKAGEYIVGVQPLTDIHLNDEYPAGFAPVSDWRYPYILTAVAVLILLLACINFITLAIGRSVTRAKEVGVRKVAGATRLQLMQQFWSEAILTAFLAIIAGILLAELALPSFNLLASKELNLVYHIPNIAFFVGLVLVIGLAAGIYPALVLSGFSPINVFKGAMSKLGAEKHLVLRSLVGFQFVLSIGLIICTFIMQGQLQFLQNKNLGFNKEQIVILPYSATPSQGRGFGALMQEGAEKANLLKAELARQADVKSVTHSLHTFGTPGWVQLGYTERGSDKFRQFFTNGIDYNFIPTMGIELLEGRNFSEDIGTDREGAVIVNEAYAKAFGLENPVGQNMPEPFQAMQIIGLAKDFNFTSLHNPVDPLVLAVDARPLINTASDWNFGDAPIPKISLQLAAGNIPAILGKVEQAWKKVAPNQAFNISFMDDNIQRQYQAESRLSQILSIATMLAIFIACLGLFGIASLTVAQRTKEIGVRKILGASTSDIVLMLNKRFTFMVIAATIIAAPLAWFFMNQWLADFAYAISINPLTFVLAGLSALIVAWLAVSYQSIRAAVANPVKSLRYE